MAYGNSVFITVKVPPSLSLAPAQGELMKVIYYISEESGVLESLINGYEWPLFMAALALPDREGQEWAARANFRLVKVPRTLLNIYCCLRVGATMDKVIDPWGVSLLSTRDFTQTAIVFTSFQSFFEQLFFSLHFQINIVKK